MVLLGILTSEIGYYAHLHWLRLLLLLCCLFAKLPTLHSCCSHVLRPILGHDAPHLQLAVFLTYKKQINVNLNSIPLNLSSF